MRSGYILPAPRRVAVARWYRRLTPRGAVLFGMFLGAVASGLVYLIARAL